MRNHHRICDAQKHLLQTLDKPKEKIFDNYIINLTINACGSCDVKTAYLKRGGMNNEALGGSNWVVSANFILLQANEESQFL